MVARTATMLLTHQMCMLKQVALVAAAVTVALHRCTTAASRPGTVFLAPRQCSSILASSVLHQGSRRWHLDSLCSQEMFLAFQVKARCCSQSFCQPMGRCCRAKHHREGCYFKGMARGQWASQVCPLGVRCLGQGRRHSRLCCHHRPCKGERGLACRRVHLRHLSNPVVWMAAAWVACMTHRLRRQRPSLLFPRSPQSLSRTYPLG